MRVGFLTCDLTHQHGWAHYGLSMARALSEQGVDLKVICAPNIANKNEFSAQALLPPVDPMPPKMNLRLIQALPKVREILRDCDIVHVAIEPYAPLGYWVKGNKPLFVTGHGSYVRAPVERSFPINFLYRRAFLASTMICVSRYTSEVARGVLPGLRTEVVNNGVNEQRFSRLSPIPHDRPTVLCVGAVKARKGTLALVEAIAAVREKIPNILCVLIGTLDAEPEYADRVAGEIEVRGLNQNVWLMGRVPEQTLLEWYASADVFVLPSLNIDWKFEGYGLSLLEASAAGLPVIGARDCGAEDAVQHGVTGLLVSQLNLADELTQAILSLFHNPVRAREMGNAGKAFARAQTWENAAKQVIQLYERELAGR